MKQEIADRWVEALESGKYEQGTGALNRDGRFCCMGVLCDILQDDLKAAWVENIDNNFGEGYLVQGSDAKQHTSFPYASYKDIGCKLAFQQKLIHMNDRDGKSFSEIAEYIRKNYKSF